MNNEPVAWIIDANMTDCDDNFIWNTGGYPDWQVEDWIPLYTHPAKTLTDEEILDALKDAWNGWKYIREVHGDLYGVGWDRVQDKLEAILRKAQEK